MAGTIDRMFAAGFDAALEKFAKTLTTAGREHIKKKNFALPGRRYPIEDEAHARAALSRISQHGTAGEQVIVRKKVKQRFPQIGQL